MGSRSSIGYAVAMVLLAAAALAIRLPRLAERPFHGDEANQAVRTGILLEEGEYRYDPHEHHGPTLYYLALIPIRLSGAKTLADTTEAVFRILPVLFGVGVVLLLWPLGAALGRGAVLAAGLLTVLSPAMVYYSRYYIQEMLLVFFALLLILAGWRWFRRPHGGWAALAGFAAGAMFATKETCVVLFFAMAVALAGTMFWARLHSWHGRPAREESWARCPCHSSAGVLPVKEVGRPAPHGGKMPPPLDAHATWSHAALFVGVAIAVSVVLFSSFFTHPRGMLDSVLAFTTYSQRAEGTGSAGIHDKPWYYYLHLLAYTYRTAGPRWSEGLVLLLAAAGAVSILLVRPACAAASSGPDARLLRFLLLYCVVTTAIYSLIPYKTPWNLLPFYQPMILLAGVGVAALFRRLRPIPLRIVLALLLAIGVAHLGRQCRLANFVYPADVRNPYVYAHTSTAVRRLVESIDHIAAVHPEGKDMLVRVLQPDADYWPLPWLLRQYSRVGYWGDIPDAPDAPVIIADPSLGPVLQERLAGEYMVEMHGLRPSVLRLLFIRRDLWDAFMAPRR